MPAASRCCIHAYVSGRVQGVWFRAFTREQALARSVTGWARNLPDGRVEVMLEGAETDVNAVLDALRQGPPLAQVTDLLQESVELQHFEAFTTG